MKYDKGYENLVSAIVKRSIEDLISALCQREDARFSLKKINNSGCALYKCKQCNDTIKEIEKFFNGDLLSLSDFNGPRIFRLVCDICEDMNYDYKRIKELSTSNEVVYNL